MRTDIITKNAQGEIIIPEQYSYIMSQPYIRHREPTTDPGFYHRHLIHAKDAWEMHLAYERFFIGMRDNFPNFVYLSSTGRNGSGTGQAVFSDEIFYAMNGAVPPETKGNRMLGAMLYPYR